MSTLAVVEAILREAAMPLSVREIVERAGEALPTKSKTPDTVVARDLSMDIKKRADGSTFVRTSPGRYAIRTQATTLIGEGTQPISTIGASASVVPPPPLPTAIAAPAPAPSISATPSPSMPEAGSATSLVGQSLPHDRSGTRPAPTKAKNSEDTPMSA